MKTYAAIETKSAALETPIQRLASLHSAYVASKKEVAAKASAQGIVATNPLGRTDVGFVPVMASEAAHPKAAG